MTKTHKYKSKRTIKNLETMVLSNPGDRWGRLLARWTAADVDERESLEETAIVERLGRFVFFENSHAGSVSTGHASGNFGGKNCS
jgi:hypothetical protein